MPGCVVRLHSIKIQRARFVTRLFRETYNRIRMERTMTINITVTKLKDFYNFLERTSYVEVDQDGRVTRPPYSLKNGATYTGQWLNEMRDGYGIQIWPDGSRYEGQWRMDKANGQGKLNHADGDIYEGQWVNDKAQGNGCYSHANGAYYEG